MTSFIAVLACLLASAASSVSLGQVRRIYVERMPNALDQYLRAEIYKQFKDKVLVVLDRKEADGMLIDSSGATTFNSSKSVVPAADPIRDGRVIVSLVDKSGKVMLWTDEAGDRSLLFKHGGARTIAEHLVHKLKHAIEASR
jgi:hypothetical protein